MEQNTEFTHSEMQIFNADRKIEDLQEALARVERQFSMLRNDLELANRRIGIASHVILALLTAQDLATGLWAKGHFDGADPAKPFDSVQNALSMVAKALCVR